MEIDIKLILEYSKSLNVLYVEDEDTLRKQTAKLFDNYFQSVTTACNGLEALETFRTNNSGYDLIISDINMPEMNGIDMAEAIRSIDYNQSIIFITAHNENAYLNRAIELGVSGFLVKPIQDQQLKQVLFKTTQAIAEHKLLQRHEEHMIAENIRLYEQEKSCSKKLSVKNVHEIIDIIESRKEDLTHTWVENKSVNEKLHKHSIDTEFFRTHYAVKVLDYFIGVIRGTNVVGQCPVINALLEFFRHKNLPLESIFIICVNFKNTLTAFTFEHYDFTPELFDELSLVLDKNFEGVVHHYMESKKQKTKPVTQKIVKQEDETPQNDAVINYAEYVFEHDIFELKELEVEIENLAIAVTMNQNKTLDEFVRLGSHIEKYGDMLVAYPLFVDLGTCIKKLGNSFHENAEALHEAPQTTNNIATLLEGFVNDLILWRKELFENNTDNPHFLNASFFSNVDTIISYIEADENTAEEDEGIEFF